MKVEAAKRKNGTRFKFRSSSQIYGKLLRPGFNPIHIGEIGGGAPGGDVHGEIPTQMDIAGYCFVIECRKPVIAGGEMVNSAAAFQVSVRLTGQILHLG